MAAQNSCFSMLMVMLRRIVLLPVAPGDAVHFRLWSLKAVNIKGPGNQSIHGARSGDCRAVLTLGAISAGTLI